MANPGQRVLIIGGGFGGIYTALQLDKTLAREPGAEVTLVCEQNFMLFTPMLHEVAASDLDPTDIVNPIRRMFRHVRFLEGTVGRIDLEACKVSVAYAAGDRQRELEYDRLDIAPGSDDNFFGNEEIERNAVTMKTLTDAVLLRNRAHRRHGKRRVGGRRSGAARPPDLRGGRGRVRGGGDHRRGERFRV